MASRTAVVISGLTLGDPLTTRETVARETPALAATISSVGAASECVFAVIVHPPSAADTFVVDSPHDRRRGDPRLRLGDQLGVGQRTVLRRAHQRLVIDVHDAEPLLVTPCPLEVVEQ